MTVRVPDPPIRDFSRRAVSLPAILSFVVGLALLAAVTILPDTALDLPPSEQTGLTILACGLLLMALRTPILRLIFGRRLTAAPSREVVRLPREGMVYLVIMLVVGLGALVGRSNLLMLVFAMMAGPYVVNGWVVSTMLRRVRVSRNAPPRAIAGRPVSVELSMENGKRFISSRVMSAKDRVRNTAEDSGRNGEEVLEPAVLFLHVPPQERRRASYVLHLMRRGEYQFGPLYTSSRFPLGLGERGRWQQINDRILVHPPIGRIVWDWKDNTFRDSERVEQQQGSVGPFDDEFHRVREFRSGDNPRAIHWRTSARLNELMIREFEQNRDHDLTVLLDLWLPGQPDSRNLADLEMAISFTATLCVEHVRDTHDTHLSVAIAAKRPKDVSGPARHTTLEAVLDALAVACGSSKSSLGKLIRYSTVANAARARTIVVTPRHEAAVERLAQVTKEYSTRCAVTSLRDIQIVHATTGELAKILTFPGPPMNGNSAPQLRAASLPALGV